jgi:hypothetical protein
MGGGFGSTHVGGGFGRGHFGAPGGAFGRAFAGQHFAAVRGHFAHDRRLGRRLFLGPGFDGGFYDYGCSYDYPYYNPYSCYPPAYPPAY